jgi:hypothetical protein
MSETEAPAASAVASRPIGEQRSPGKVLLLSIVTFGIYGLVWTYKTYQETHDYLGEGWTGIMGILPIISIANAWKIPSQVGQMYTKDGQVPPVTGKTGFLVFIPIAGGFMWLWRVQGALNQFWASKGAPSA